MTLAVRARALPDLLAQMPADTRILSLDCFDTLIWRNVNMPTDVFADLPIAGGGVEARTWAEQRARKIAPFLRDGGDHEVSIEDIYREMAPHLNEAGRAAMVEAELAAEARHCFAFAPVRDLIVDAKRRGLQVIIVSDTYLSEPQLRQLIAAAGGDALANMIDRIFCSSVYGVSKAGGLFAHVLADLGVSPGHIVHVGDNQTADQIAPAKLGITGVHFQQFDESAQQRLRFEAAAAALVAPDARVTLPVYQPHRAALSLRQDNDPTFVLGHDVLGPILHSFADWLKGEAEAMEERLGRPVKLLFLLRDGYLPGAIFRASHPDLADRAIDVALSRFTATAASFGDEDAIRRFATAELSGSPATVVGKQLLFSKDETVKMARGLTRAAYLKTLLKPQNVRRIVGRSQQFADRLCAYLRKQGVADGDAVMLVDLGYNGSVQNMAEATLRSKMNLEIAGRYLLLRELQGTNLDKRGFIDTRNYDSRLLHALSESISLVEQMCTVAQGSVVDYRADGTAVRDREGVNAEQSACRDTIQTASLAYAVGTAAGQVRPPVSDDADCRRHMAVASLARLLFLPLAQEVEALKDFYHDVNKGTDMMLKLVDLDAASQGMRQRGLFYTKSAMRTYVPGELQGHGLPINLSLLSARRFGLELNKADFDVGGISLPVILIDGASQQVTQFNAVPTAEGYYQALIPVGAGRFAVGAQIGQIAQWVQIDQCSFHVVEQFMDMQFDQAGIPATPIVDAMTQMAPGLFHSPDPLGFALFTPPPSSAPMLLNIVFRPVVSRDAPVAQPALKVA